MRGGLIFLSTLILSLAAGLGGYSLYHQWNGGSQGTASTRGESSAAGVLGQHRPDFTLTDLDGRQRSNSEWDGKVVLLNFWATWCPPCRREIPVLADVYREHQADGFVVLGIAIDNPVKVARFVERFELPYPNLVGHSDASRVAADYGNAAGSLPYSVILGRDGTVEYLHLGEISRDTLVAKIVPLLAVKPGKNP